MYSEDDASEINKRLSHVIDFIEKIENFTAAHSFEEYLENEIAYYGLEKLFQNIGEALNKTPNQFKKNNPQISWSKIIRMRNIIAHDYDDIDEHILWTAALTDIPLLKQQIQTILDKENDPT